jgi:hypothetical protein
MLSIKKTYTKNWGKIWLEKLKKVVHLYTQCTSDAIMGE